jgi:hypothetical protein
MDEVFQPIFSEASPTSVPYLEQYFALLDSNFAQWFFAQVLSEEFLSLQTDRGLDVMWCAAANQYDRQRNSCQLVPLVSLQACRNHILLSGIQARKPLKTWVCCGGVQDSRGGFPQLGWRLLETTVSNNSKSDALLWVVSIWKSAAGWYLGGLDRGVMLLVYSSSLFSSVPCVVVAERIGKKRKVVQRMESVFGLARPPFTA